MKVKINKIVGNKHNPRVIKDNKFEKLKKSISEFPEMLEKRAIVCTTRDDGKYEIIGGNMRFRVCQDLGYKEVPIILADDWSDKQVKQFIIKDNVSAGEWDWDNLGNEWNLDELQDWGLDVWNISDNTILDIEEITNFSESVNFIIKCQNIEELENLKSRLKTDANKLDCKKLFEIFDT
jgi:ParB-like chromosome segregation protein Spo0J